MALICETPAVLKLNYSDLIGFSKRDQPRFERNFGRTKRRADQWIASPTPDDPSTLLVAFDLSVGSKPYLRLKDVGEDDPIPLIWETVQTEMLGTYTSNGDHLALGKGNPAGVVETGLSIVDALAFGAFPMAQTLVEHSLTFLHQRAYTTQSLTAEDKALSDEDKKYLTIIPNRVFPFALQLMLLDAGPLDWDDWDITVDMDYVNAAKSVLTTDLDEAEQILCKLANLHVQHSNPFPDGNDDDHLSGFEFDTPLRALWPSEIHAWLRVRQMHGLALPQVEHPLLDQPLGHFAISPSRPAPSDFFRGAVDALVDFHPRYAELPRLLEMP